jgi:hypothetical protein
VVVTPALTCLQRTGNAPCAGISVAGIQIIERRSQWPDPATAISAMAAQMKSVNGVTVQTLAGVPALVIPEDSDSTGANPASVTMVVASVYIEIISHRPASDLTRLAATLS